MPILAKTAFNIALVITAISMVLLRSVRGAHWGPEGPVGAWLLLLPPLFLLGGVLVVMILMGRFDWVLGGRVVSFLLLIGFLIAAAPALWFMFDTGDEWWKEWAGLAPWAMLAGCAIAVNIELPAGLAAKTAIAATLGSTALAGWALTFYGLVGYVEQQNQMALSAVENERAFESDRAKEFLALGPDAPLWNYFGYMYMSDETLRRECRDIIAHRPDLNQQLIAYLGNPVLAESVRNYIADVAENPSAELAPAFAAYSDSTLKDYREVLRGQSDVTDRARHDIGGILTACNRLQHAGADLKPQASAWRDYLRRFENATDLENQAAEVLR
jgi:hypothetical protein